MPVEQLALRPLVTPELLKTLTSDLKNHLENRIQLFLQQMILVYKTKLCFSFYPHADAQVGQVLSPKKAEESTYVDAHSGTLPTLRLNQAEFSDVSISFAQNTSFYYAWNTTVYIPEIANQIDSAIDRSTANGDPLRKTATDILNKVSSGALCPKEGLRDFLAVLISLLNAIQSPTDSEQRKIILEQYLKIADNYYDNTENGYPLIQKLCLRPMQEMVDDQFYMSVQAEMHKQLKSELPQIEPPLVSPQQLPADVNVISLQSLVAEKLPNVNSRTAQQYIKLCTLARTVRDAATKYLLFLHQLIPAKRNEDLDRILIMNKSEASSSLYDAALEAIRSQRPQLKKKPQNMSFILLSILIAISRDLISSQSIPLPVPSQTSASSAKKQLCSQIEEKIKAANLQSKVTTEKYIKLCAGAEKVRAAAALFFNELLHLPDSLKEKEIDKLFLVQKSKVGCAGFSPKAFAFYAAVLEAIQAASKKKVSNPRNMPLILSRLLLDLSSSMSLLHP